MPDHPRWIIQDRAKAVDKLYATVAADLGLTVDDGVIEPSRRWQAVDAAESAYRDWCMRADGESKPVMRTKTDVALSNLYAVDHPAAF